MALRVIRCAAKFGRYRSHSRHRTGIASISDPRQHARERLPHGVAVAAASLVDL